jgi:hypothetical protein
MRYMWGESNFYHRTWKHVVSDTSMLSIYWIKRFEWDVLAKKHMMILLYSFHEIEYEEMCNYEIYYDNRHLNVLRYRII